MSVKFSQSETVNN